MTKHYEGFTDPNAPQISPHKGESLRVFVERNRQYKCSVFGCDKYRAYTGKMCQKHANNLHIWRHPLGHRIQAKEVEYERSIVDQFWSINKGHAAFSQATEWIVSTCDLVARGKLELRDAAKYPCLNWHAHLVVDAVDPAEFLKLALSLILADHRVHRKRIIFGRENALSCVGKSFAMHPPKILVSRPKYKRGSDLQAIRRCADLLEAGLGTFFTAMVSNLLILKRKIQTRENAFLANMNTEPLT
jgi:hypothetical protein